MKRIKAILFSHLRNEAHYEFLFFYLNLLAKFPHVNQLVTYFYSMFTDLLNKERKLLDATSASPFTQQLADEDNRIDRDIAAIKASIKAAHYHLDPAIVEAARVLNNRLKIFGTIRSKPYEEEAAAVQVLVDDLQTTYAPQVALTGIAIWVTDLAEAESNFTQLYEQRNVELAERPHDRFLDIRHQIEAVYHSMITLINAAVIMDEEDKEYIQFIEQLNTNITYFNEHNHHHTRKDISVTDHCVIEPIPTQTYTGKPIVIIPNAHYREEGKPTVELVFSVDFTITYKNNVEVGMADLILHGKGKYKGQKVVTFSIS
jgi:hypothetical protein